MNHIALVAGVVGFGVVASLSVLALASDTSRKENLGMQEKPLPIQLNVSAKTEEPKLGSYVEFVEPHGFVNTEPLTMEELIGKKVILVNFITYSCINCQRTFPHVNEWYEKYKGQGLEIVGIHTPEFAFEKDIDNVREAMQNYHITYPIVLDNDYATWRAYANNYWPRKYLIDIEGNIIYDHIGEGAYEETEEKIREALADRAKKIESVGL